MDRWKRAWAVLWRTEPAPALALYFLVVAATAGYVHLVGAHFASSLGSLHTVLRRDGSTAGLVTYAFFTWRIWLGGSLFWTLSLLWNVLLLVLTVNACYRTSNLFVFGLLALALANLLPLFASAVLDRVTRAGQDRILRARRPAFREGCEQPRLPRPGEIKP